MRGLKRASRSTMALPSEIDEAADRKVVDRDGHDLGHVIDVLYDEFHTERAYLEIESDHTFERHHKHFLAPLSAADLTQDPIVVPISVEESEKPPGWHSSMPFSETYEMAILGYWDGEMHQDTTIVHDTYAEGPAAETESRSRFRLRRRH